MSLHRFTVCVVPVFEPAVGEKAVNYMSLRPFTCEIFFFFVENFLSFVGKLLNDMISIMTGLYSPATARKGKGKKVKISFTVFRIQSCKHIVHKDNCLYLGSEVKLGIPSVHLTLLVNSISFPLNFSVIERLPFRLRTSTSK